MQEVRSLLARYRGDLAFRGDVSLRQGMVVNFLYVLFRGVAAVRFTSAWFVSMAVYYLVLGCLRVYLARSYRRHDRRLGWKCYRRVGWLLFLLDIPMAGMVIMMVRTDSGFSYPGYVIYLSALYTFYAFGAAISNLVRYRRLGDPILSASKALGFVSALMSVLALQTAMIAAFSSHGDGYRVMMNSITGGCVCAIVAVLAILMLVRSGRAREGADASEQV